MKKVDLTGQRFGRLVVIEEADDEIIESNGKKIFKKYKCKCDCGKYTNVRKQSLLNQYTKSCGCLGKERFIEDVKKYLKNNKKEGTLLSALDAKMPKNNKSGHKGVIRQKSSGKWLARITFKRKSIHLGTFTNKQDAINARKKAEEKYFKPILEKYSKEDTDK